MQKHWSDEQKARENKRSIGSFCILRKRFQAFMPTLPTSKAGMGLFFGIMTSKRWIYGLGIALLLGLFAGIWKFTSLLHPNKTAQSDEPDFEEPVVGFYDRHSPDGLRKETFQHTHLTLSKDASDDEVQAFVSGVVARQVNLITVEISAPFGGSGLEETVQGAYDRALTAYCQALGKSGQMIYLRWCPDMEVPIHRYPWQYQPPILYRTAFQHVAKVCRASSPAIRLVWSPAGYPGADEFWPGKDAVDLISVTIDGPSEQQLTAYPRPADQATAIRRKILRMRFLDKPVLILAARNVKEAILTTNQLRLTIDPIKAEEPLIYTTLSTMRPPLAPDFKRTDRPKIGVYDPRKLLLNNKSVQVEHIFTDLGNIQDGSFEKEFKAVIARKHDVIVTFEPWKNKGYKASDKVLLNTTKGVYDAIFKQLYAVLSATNQTVYLRFAHEMEIPIERYAWQSQDPVLYIKAFRYFMNYPGNKAANLKKVWGPAGDRGSMEWWPGDDVVDYISVAIYGLPDKNITDPTKQETFETIYNRKSYRMRFSSKPLFVTEFGVKGPDDFQRQWLENAARTINSHPEIKGVCYFNLMDNPEVWGKIKTPDWSISAENLEHFVQLIPDKNRPQN